MCVKSHLLVRQAAKGGGVLTFRGSKKYHRFFQWNRKYPTASPKKKAQPRLGIAGRLWPGKTAPRTGKHAPSSQNSRPLIMFLNPSKIYFLKVLKE